MCNPSVPSIPVLSAPTLRAPSLSYLPRRVDRQIQAVHHQGITSVARIQSAALVTHTAMTYSASLSAEEDRLIRETGSRALEFRLAAVVDSFAALSCTEIARMGWRQ